MENLARFRRQRLAVAVTCALAASPLACFAPAAYAQNVDLGNLGDRGFRIDGIDLADSSGESVSGAGDVNGDGLADVIIGAPRADPGGVMTGETYVVFGRSSNASVDLADLGMDGFRIEGIDYGDFSGASVSGAGDVNGDGLDDLIVGAYRGRAGGDLYAGESYVVFGKVDSSLVDLANLGAGGFRIDGVDPQDLSGKSVSSAGDVNGDGLADLIVGASAADPNGNASAGESYVVFGKTTSTPVDLGLLGGRGFRIDGIDAGDRSGYSVAGAGDVNGDGLADVIVGAYGASVSGSAFAGESYVVFGKASGISVSLANLGVGGFRIDGIDVNDGSGLNVSGAGDVNGDGLADLIVVALFADPNGDAEAGESYIVFGKTDSAPVDLAQLGQGGFRVEGIDAGDMSGGRASGAGDVNGDGLADLIFAARGGDPNGNEYAGESYVVFGKADSAPVDLGALGPGGFRMDGIDTNDNSGVGISGAGDINGDGLADLIVGAPGADAVGNDDAGESYVIFSTSVPPMSAIVRSRSRNGNAPSTAFGITGDGSNHSTPDARAWIDFRDGVDPLGAASLETVTLTRSAGSYASAGARVSWRVETSRQDWTTAEVRFRYLDSELLASENSLQVMFSATGDAPFTTLLSAVSPFDNTITATATQAGYFFLGSAEFFADGFERVQPLTGP